jgi:hypothetical protein
MTPASLSNVYLLLGLQTVRIPVRLELTVGIHTPINQTINRFKLL